MGKEVLPVRLDREIIEILEEIVKAGFFPDKSKAARELLKLGLEKFNEDMMARISSLVDMAYNLIDNSYHSICILCGKGSREISCCNICVLRQL